MNKIMIIHTGGTFGMVPAEPDKTLIPAQIQDQVLANLPEIQEIADVKFGIAFNIDSSNIQIHHWIELAELVYQNLNSFDGFVIIHGTDAMVYSACALSFMLQGINKPIILTGSQRPISQIRTDARTNLINALELATCDIPEVTIFFGTHLYRGNRTVKISSHHYDAFVSPNYPPLAEVGLNISISEKFIYSGGGPLNYRPKLDNRVFYFRFIPGMSPKHLDFLSETDYEAVVIEALGAGNLSVFENSMIPWIEKMTSIGKIVVINSQSLYGKIDLNLYECGKKVREAGGISAEDMSGVASVMKLMFLLAIYPGNIGKVKLEFSKPLAGEMNSPGIEK